MLLNRDKYREEVDLLESENKKSKLTLKRISDLKQLITQDEEEANTIKENMETWLIRSAEQYMQCLVRNQNTSKSIANDDSTMTAVVRLLGLLLKNPNEVQLHNNVREKMEQLNIALFVPFVQQISSALFEDSHELRRTFSKLLILMLKVSPHKCLPSILLLARDSEGDSGRISTYSKGRASPNTVGNSIASQILKQFVDNDKYFESILSSYQNVAEAYIILAEWFPPAARKVKNKRKFLKPGAFYKDFGKVVENWNACIRAADLKQELVTIWTGEKDSEDLPKLVAIKNDFKILNGLSRPKLIQCYDNIGNEYTQIVKAGDDLRGDEVVEQVFGVINSLLRRDHKCRDRKLNLRTYNIAPLSSNVGVIELAGEKTKPIGEFLSNAHARLRPNDLSADDVSTKLRDALKQKSSTRIKLYKDLCKNFRPCMYDEMVVRCPDSQLWYKNRISFTRSVAVNSIAGYIIGLGDRHVSNILIDTSTFEVVHIDFGILFERGKQLATPEKVPFRLTRDFVDGMGVLGYEGVFQRSCEETMRVLRNHDDALLFIFDAFVHNPLSNWKNAAELWQLKNRLREDDNSDQNADGGNIDSEFDNNNIAFDGAQHELTRTKSRGSNQAMGKNKEAERAISRIKEKLRGFHNGNLMGVEGHVNILINEATDAENLALIFPGWSPWY